MYYLKIFSASVPFRKIPISVWLLVLYGTNRNRLKYEPYCSLFVFLNYNCENMFFHNFSKIINKFSLTWFITPDTCILMYILTVWIISVIHLDNPHLIHAEGWVFESQPRQT